MLNAAIKDESNVQVPAPELECRISALIGLFNSRTEAAVVAGMSTDQLARYEKGTTPSFPPLAKLAAAKRVRLDWLASGKGSMHAEAASDRGSQPVRLEGLTISIQLAAEALDGKTLPPDDYAELVTLIYQGLEEGLPEATILRFARIAKPK